MSGMGMTCKGKSLTFSVFLFLILALIMMEAAPVFGAISYFEVRPGPAKPSPAGTTISIFQGSTVTIRVNGNGTDLARSVSVSGSRVSASITGRKNGLQHKHYRTKLPLGEVSIRVSVRSNARVGIRTVTIKYPIGQDRFKIRVQRKPRPGSVDVAGRRPSHPKKNGMFKLAAPFNAPHIFFPPIAPDHKGGKGINDLDCRSYRNLPFPTCYRTHTGTDFLMSGGFGRMDSGSVVVTAAAPGTVHKIENGKFDRCIGDPKNMTINCRGKLGRDQEANYVIIKQDDDLYAGYYHLKKKSVPSYLKKGMKVKCGDYLGLVGSSGTSAYPHLHFHLSRGSNHDDWENDPFIDPYKEGLWISKTRSHVPNGQCPRR